MKSDAQLEMITTSVVKQEKAQIVQKIILQIVKKGNLLACFGGSNGHSKSQ